MTYDPGHPLSQRAVEQSQTWTDDFGHELLNVHHPDVCAGRHCCIHNPSDHHMRDFPRMWRGDRGFMERICPHGTGHPDPDAMDHMATYKSPEDVEAFGVHGCDGCCAPPPTRPDPGGRRVSEERKRAMQAAAHLRYWARQLRDATALEKVDPGWLRETATWMEKDASAVELALPTH